MKIPRFWRGLVAGSVAALTLGPSAGLTFVEKTETQGEIPVDLNGVWLLVSDIEHQPPTPTPKASPGPGDTAQASAEPGGTVASPAAAQPSPLGSAAPIDTRVRVYSVPNLYKITHLKKPEVDRIKEEEAKRQQLSIDKANAIVAAEKKKKKAAPAKGEGGEAEGPKVLVPVNDSLVQPDGDDIDIALLDVVLPKAIMDSVLKAQEAQTRWVPTDKERALLRSSWSTLKLNPHDEYSKIEWKVVAKDKFDAGLKQDTKVKGSAFAITGNHQMIPRAGQPSTSIVVYGVKEDTGQTLSGGHVRAMMATSPFPIPIDMKGSFTMYRIADLPKSAPAKAAAKPKSTPQPK